MQHSFQRNPVHLFGRNTICLKEMFYSPKITKDKLESAASFESYTMIWQYVTILSITPFLCKYVTLLSKNSSCARLGQEHLLVEGTVSFTKNIILHPQRLHTWKGNLHIPKEYCASLAYKIFWNNDLTRIPGGEDESDLVWINLDSSGLILRNQKPKETKKTMFSRLVWTCLNPSSPQNIVFFLKKIGWWTTLSSISTRKGLCMDSKRPILFEKNAFCALTTSPSVFLIEKACVSTTKNNVTSDHVIYWQKNNECIQTIGDFSDGNKPFWQVYSTFTVFFWEGLGPRYSVIGFVRVSIPSSGYLIREKDY